MNATESGKYRILLVEDDEVIAEQMKNYLEKWGYEVVCARDFEMSCRNLPWQRPTLCCWT